MLTRVLNMAAIMADDLIADHYKQKGNDAMKSNDFNSAVKFYCQAISQSPQNHVLYSNRSAAYIKLECYQEALDDAEKTIALQKDWAKGYSRKGSALFKLGQLKEAGEAYRAGLKVEPDNAILKEGLKEVRLRQKSEVKESIEKFIERLGPDFTVVRGN